MTRSGAKSVKDGSRNLIVPITSFCLLSFVTGILVSSCSRDHSQSVNVSHTAPANAQTQVVASESWSVVRSNGVDVVHDANYYKSFVFVAAVHDLPTPGDSFSNTWEHAHNILVKSGIQDDMVSSHGVASISVEPDKARQAADLIRRDASSNGYWVSFAKAFR